MQFVADYAKLRKTSLRGYTRHAALSALATAYRLSRRTSRLLQRPRVQIVYIHHVFRDEERSFRAALEALARQHTFVPYSEAVNRILQGDIDRPYLAFSSDDGLRSNRRAAAILEEFGARACFFIYPSMIGETDIAKIAAFNAQRIHFPPVEYLDWDDVDALLDAGHEIGGHSVTHANMAAISHSEQRDEAAQSYAVLRHRCGSVTHFAWPYGRFRHFNASARQATFDAGYRTIASAERGSHVGGEPVAAQDLCIRRDHVVAAWPRDHILYLLARNALRADVDNNRWPY